MRTLPAPATSMPHRAPPAGKGSAEEISIVQQFVSSSRRLGIFGALPASICTTEENHADSSLGQVLSMEVRNSLFAVSLEIYHYRVQETVTEPRRMSQDLLRMSVPALTPNLTWKSHSLLIGNSLLLILFSYTWCLNVEFANISIRCHSLSCIIYEDNANYPTSSYDWDELKHRTDMALYIQDAILALLHNQRKPRCHFQTRTKSQVTDSAWHAPCSVTLDLRDSQPFEDNSYFVLMHPLANCIRAVVEAPLFGNREWLMARNELSSYFFHFPPTLLRFEDLTYPCEAEAMIWTHGLFINLYGTRDLVDLIMDPVYLEVNRFSYLLEHSLLLGDILPTILSLDPYLDGLSPATVFFILHSAIVHAMALRQFISSDSRSRVFLDAGAPGKLVRSSDYHWDTLSSIQRHCKRYDIPLIEEVQSLLSYYLSRATFRAPSATAITARTLMHYRWCRGGTGIIPLQREDADAEWQYSVSPDENVWQDQPEYKDILQPMIVKLCTPDARICRNGYFDLSILIR